MFVDIHTHSSSHTDYPAIRNLTFEEGEIIFTSNEKGFFSVGFHPWYADEFSQQQMDKLSAWSTDHRMSAIGECGLDKNSKVAFEKQVEVFELQIALSEKMVKPLIVHSVGSFNELFEIKKRWNPQQLWIIHGFRGKPELARQALNTGCALSFGEHFNPESVRLTPTGSLYVETDESTMPISEIYHSIALIKHCNPFDLDAGENLLKLNK